MMKHMWLRYGMVVLAAVMLSGCAHLMWWKHDDAEGAKKAEPAAKTEAEAAQPVDYEAALDAMVQDQIASVSANTDAQSGKLTRRKPYYFKEYSVYPDGASSFEKTIRKTESRTAPYVANVSLSKQRFATRLHTKKDEARSDDRFLRETGKETLTYEFRGRDWRPLGSFFVVEKTEENVNGEWVPVEPEVQRSISTEEKDEQSGWWTRTWSRILGRD